MKKILFLTILLSPIFVFTLISPVFANSDHNHGNKIENGRELIDSEASCDKLSDDQLEAVGEYLMEQMHSGDSHESMHEMMGMKEGSEYHRRFHIDLAEEMYCGDNRMGGMQMMQNNTSDGTKDFRSEMMTGDMMSMMMGGGNSAMNSFTANPLGWILMILFWGFIILAIIALIRLIVNQSNYRSKKKSAKEILEKRYAEGEIDKEEFEEKKKDLT